MGEYATYKGESVKIGTCEDLLYLRWDQAHKVTAESGSLDPTDPSILDVIRFRFPWPDEDDTEPGGFDDPFRGLTLWGFEQPADLPHSTTQFKSSYPDNGYLVSLPCPESGATISSQPPPGGSDALKHTTLTIHRNGYGGPAKLIQQAWRGGRLVGIVECNGCGHTYRLDDGYQDAAAVSIRASADRIIRDGRPDCAEGDAIAAARLHEIADRLLAGYALAVPA